MIAATGTTVIAMAVTAKYLKDDGKAMPLGFSSDLKLEKNFCKELSPTSSFILEVKNFIHSTEGLLWFNTSRFDGFLQL